MTISVGASTLYYPKGNGHFWAQLNWALGVQSNGCNIIWVEKFKEDHTPISQILEYIKILRSKLSDFGIKDLALYPAGDTTIPKALKPYYIEINEAARQSDLFINLQYNIPDNILSKFRKTAFVDIDPGLIQVFMANGTLNYPDHDMYFTIGETVGLTSTVIPTVNKKWHFIPQCVSLEKWTPAISQPSANFTTISHWNDGAWMIDSNGQYYSNDKRDGFLPYIDLPKFTTKSLELALCLDGDINEKEYLEKKGWQVRESEEISDTPKAYQEYIQNSRGEFSCAKPSYVRLETAWISDRTLCYLASGKPAIVEFTGPSRFLPSDAGLFRFKNLSEAIRSLEQVESDYENQCVLARKLTVEYFDAKKNTAQLLSLIL